MRPVFPKELIAELNALKPRYDEHHNRAGELAYPMVVFDRMPSETFWKLNAILEKTYGQRPQYQHLVDQGIKDEVADVKVAGDLPLQALATARLKIDGLPQIAQSAAR